MSETTEQPVSSTATARKRGGEGLSGMVLADLKAMASQLGIKGTSGLRKGDLVSAIESHQGAGAPAARRAGNGAAVKAVKTGDAENVAPVGSTPPPANGRTAEPTLSLDIDLPQRPARRRSSGRPEGAPEVAAGPPAVDVAPAVTAAPRADGQGPDTAVIVREQPANGQSTAGSGVSAVHSGPNQGGERTERVSYDNEDGPRSSRRNRRNRRDRDNRGGEVTSSQDTGTDAETAAPAPNRDGQNRDGQNRDGQNRDGQDRSGPNREQNRNSGRDNNRPDGNRQGQDRNSGPNRDGQDDEQGDRRGRRFRDRNRRTRDRFTDAPTDTEVRDDDVLVPVAGIVDVLDSYAFIRTSGYLSGPNDVYVSLSQIRKNGLRRGDAVTGAVRAPRDGESASTRQKFNALVRLDSVNGQDPELAKDRPEFTKLTPLYPNERLRLETEPHILTTRIIDLVMPVGKGQRALIVSPPKAGKTSILQAVANAITTNNPEVHLMVVLVDERPEEVTDMQRSVKGEVIASTFDRPPADHTMVAELSIERAKRLVEMGRDVVVLLDSITRLGRAYNLAAPASGRILSGGVDSTALFPPKRFLGAARNIENGGSLTIFASALVETGSAGDTVIFEEFKGTGNAELKLDRRIADKRIFPAIDVDQSSTRKEDLLLSPDELAITVKLRRVLSALDSQQALELLLDRLRKTKSNVEFLMQVAKTTSGV
ncbi:transcription termination factor Rho [Nakamurella panacisegetis]|uniref:Transcription termination factor Rho n=1 Tax=Nakamurella panacisegetis TaxID=1090615 RepID=A0A1H0SPE3_9ACTN|nr:transcription termination factor Rho [Nakamurella panacisegetis]SDP43624.1 transcription termination factor Rho [Nakamurella panacisegetis]